ncbi:MAG: Hpt domain-containing protein, partial [Leeuwenhoekiella sp.]
MMTEQPNIEMIKQMSGGDVSFIEKMMEIIQRELPKEITLYHEHLKNADYLTAAKDVHKLKHKISILGLEKSYKLAADYENELKNHKFSLAESFEDILRK